MLHPASLKKHLNIHFKLEKGPVPNKMCEFVEEELMNPAIDDLFGEDFHVLTTDVDPVMGCIEEIVPFESM